MVSPAQARAKNRLNPVVLFDIELLNGGGSVYFSDRTILVGSTQYQQYILNATEVSDAVKRDTSRGDNPSVAVLLNNKAFRTYSNLSLIENDYPLAGSKVTIKEIYLDDNNVQSTGATLFVGEFEEIQQENEESFKVIAMNIKVANSLKSTGRS